MICAQMLRICRKGKSLPALPDYALTAAPRRLRGRRPELRDGILEHGLDHRRVVLVNRLLERGDPLMYRLHRWLVGLGRHDAGNPDLHRRLLAREQDLIESLARPHSRERDLDVVARLKA